MPIEISEIGIRMRVDEDDGGGRVGRGPSGPGRDAEREAVIAECVRRVLQALKARQAR